MVSHPDSIVDVEAPQYHATQAATSVMALSYTSTQSVCIRPHFRMLQMVLSPCTSPN